MSGLATGILIAVCFLVGLFTPVIIKRLGRPTRRARMDQRDLKNRLRHLEDRHQDLQELMNSANSVHARAIDKLTKSFQGHCEAHRDERQNLPKDLPKGRKLDLED